MPIVWYICPYKYDPFYRNIRYCAMDDFTQTLRDAGGDWSHIEIGGAGTNGIGQALVKVKATQSIINQLKKDFTEVTDDPRNHITATRKEPRYDANTDSIILDGDDRPLAKSFATVDNNTKTRE